MKTKYLALFTGLMLPLSALASSAYGDLNNFDAVNDTGGECHGLEIELEGVHSTEITYTYDWSRYGVPTIREELASDGITPRVFIRFASKKDAQGNYLATTIAQDPANPFPATAGHQCTDPAAQPAVCDHFGVGYYPTAADPNTTPPTPAKPSLIRYNWLVDNPSAPGNLILGPALNVATPVYTYQPPVAAQPALVQAVIQAPPPPQPELAPPVQMAFGEPVWAKEIKTSSKNAQPVKLEDLVDDDPAVEGERNWLNDKAGDNIAVTAETEVEWRMMQTEFNKLGDPDQPGGANGQLVGAAEALPEGNEIVTRRYEFYRYAADDRMVNPQLTDADRSSLDGETGEAMCSEVNPTTDPADPAYLHGIGSAVTVTDANGDSYTIDCTARIVVGNYMGAQMAGFNPDNELGLIANLQPWDTTQGEPYTARSVIIGGTPPYHVTLTGSLPPGLTLHEESGILEQTGAPVDGNYPFTLQVSDSAPVPASVSKSYTLLVGNPDQPPVVLHQLSVSRSGNGSGRVYDSSSAGIDCGNSCSANLPADSSVTLVAEPGIGSTLTGWSNGGCPTTDLSCILTMSGDQSVTANFALLQYALNVSKSGNGTITGNGINCGTSCSVLLDHGTAVSLTATPASGYLFSSWSGDCTTISGNTCQATMDKARTISATFVVQPASYRISVTLNGSGSVSSSPKGISCGRTCSALFKTGSSVKLTATPAKKHTFKSWSGTVCNGSTATTCTLVVTQDVSLTASFN